MHVFSSNHWLTVGMAMLMANLFPIAAEGSALRLWGDLSSTYHERENDADGSQTVKWLNSVSLNASSYIWQPWFAALAGGLTFSQDRLSTDDEATRSNDFITGNIRFDLFPGSRFPFQIYANQNRNELDEDPFDRDIMTREFGFSQQYRPLSGRHNYTARYKRNSREESNIATYNSENLQLSTDNQFQYQVVHGDFQYDKINSEIDENETTSYSLSARQSYKRFEHVNIENTASTTSVDNQLVSGFFSTRSSQVTSLLSWQPSGRNDLNVTGSLRMFELQTDNKSQGGIPVDEALAQDNVFLNLNQGLIYKITDRLMFSESINRAFLQNQEQTESSGNESLGLSYAAKAIELGPAQYSWSLGTTLNHQQDETHSEQTLNAFFSHSLSTEYALGEHVSLLGNINQAINSSLNSSTQQSASIDHSASLSWRNTHQKTNTIVRFLVTDSRALKGEQRNFQLFNLQVTGQFRFSRYSSMSANLSLQKTVQDSNNNKTIQYIRNGQLDFVRNRLFSIPRLDFRSELRLIQQQSDSERLLSSLGESDSHPDSSWENKLEYRIGRFESTLSYSIFRNDGKDERIIKIQLSRAFGDL